MIEATLATSRGKADALWDTAEASLRFLYGGVADWGDWIARVRDKVELAASEHRPVEEIGWHRRPDVVGYSAYVDRFGGDFRGAAKKAPYLRELGVRYFHPLPVTRPRSGESDGGFAVADFLDTDPRLGSVGELREMIAAMRSAGIRVVLDFVCNHTSDDSAWAVAAKAGDQRYRAFYHLVDDRSAVDVLEGSLGEVFPQTAPGNFVWSAELSAWVWSTFYPYQWDLNYGNPEVFEAMLDVLLEQIRWGVLGFRLDSTAYIWKRAGTACKGLPEAHAVVRAWRALVSMVAPEVVFKAEAIETLAEVLPFFGDEGAECQLAYNAPVMAALWASVAMGSADVAGRAIAAAADRPPDATWLNYVRSHDDIIWGSLADYLDDRHLSALTGHFTARDGARGTAFQDWGGVGSVNGMTASLSGLGTADDDEVLRLILLLYGVTFTLDGLPLIYMGDEIALGNDEAWRDEPGHALDSRWVQRPLMDWSATERRHDRNSLEGRVFGALQRFGRVRAAHPGFADQRPARVVETGNEGVLGICRGFGDEILCLANFTPHEVEIAAPAGAANGVLRDLLDGRSFVGGVRLLPRQARWLERSV